MPILPLAPDLFSMTICCRRLRDKYSPTRRAPTSVEPPAGNGTMKRTGRLGQSCPLAVGMAAISTRDATTRRSFTIGKWSCSPASTILSVPPCVRLAATPRSRSPHAVLQLSPRAHGRDDAFAVGAVCRGLLCRADFDLYRGHLRDRRYRHGENLVADHLRHEQAAIRQARRAQRHH